MNILDENVPKNQRSLLKYWRFHVRQIGFDIGRSGMQDDEIIPLLTQLRQPTFFTRDKDFYERSLCNVRYCLVYLDVEKYEVSHFIRRLLRHPEFDILAKRIGAVIRVSSAGISFWRQHAEKESFIHWR